jgi:hypothetical protein
VTTLHEVRAKVLQLPAGLCRLDNDVVVRGLAEEILELVEELEQYRALVKSLPGPPPRGCGTCLKAAAGMAGYDPETVRRWADAGEIDGKKYGGKWLVRISSVMRRAKKFTA